MITLKTLGLAEANKTIQAGIARALEISSPSTLCVVDVGGTVIAHPKRLPLLTMRSGENAWISDHRLHARREWLLRRVDTKRATAKRPILALRREVDVAS